MNANLPADIVVELESAIAGGPPDRCARMLRRTTDLLVADGGRLAEHEVRLVDEVLIRLSERIGIAALAELSAALADLRIAPNETLRRLAFHDDPAIAAPILQKSEAITPRDLETIATTRGMHHLLALARRPRLTHSLSHILLQRGDGPLCRALVGNPGAQLAEEAYAVLLTKAEADREVAKALALRPDCPEPVLRAILAQAPEELEAELLKALPKDMRERLQGASHGSAQAPPAPPPTAIDYTQAKTEIAALSRIGKLNDSIVNRFAIRREKAHLIASLSVLSGAPIDVIARVMAEAGYECLVMACRASRLNWQTTLAILGNRDGPQLSALDRARAHDLFETQHLSTSQWAVRWGDIAAGNEPAELVSKSRGKR